ncbi:MAG: dihydrolipoamide acetyltransferase family protein [Ignavibacteriales bacterium]
MRTEIIMPKLGLTMTEGRVVQWLVPDGSKVSKGQAVAEIATEKIVTEIEAPADGWFRAIVPVDTAVPVTACIGHILEGEEAAEEEIARPSAAPAAPVAPAAPEAVAAPEVLASPASGAGVLRSVIAERMTRSWTGTPHASILVEVDMLLCLRRREEVNSSPRAGVRISVNDIVVFCAARALREHPGINSSFEGGRIVLHQDVNIGIAVALEDGLIVPVIKNADRKSLREIASQSRTLAEAAHAGSLGPDDLAGGTFTISNLGMFGIESFVPIINPPECAILGVGEVKATPVARGDSVTVRPVMKLTLSFDHRSTDGAAASRFLVRLKSLLEDPSCPAFVDFSTPPL